MPADAPGQAADVVVANILASALDALAESISMRVKPGGQLALSGILDGQQDELLDRYAPWFEALRTSRRDDWIRIDGMRRSQKS
jgi:ribosomal protein L11 methyltransferase